MRFLIALLALAGIVVSVLALRVHLEDPTQAPPCAVTANWDCGTVNHSRYASFPPVGLFEDPASHHVHIPVAIFGIVGYALIALAAATDHLWVTLQLAEIGFAFAAFLTFLEAYVIQKWCIYCVWSQSIVAVILLLTAGTLLARWLRLRRGGTLTPTQ